MIKSVKEEKEVFIISQVHSNLSESWLELPAGMIYMLEISCDNVRGLRLNFFFCLFTSLINILFYSSAWLSHHL